MHRHTHTHTQVFVISEKADATVHSIWLKSHHCDKRTLSIYVVSTTQGQRRVIGDNKEQRISQLAEVDVREERVYR